MNLMITWHRKAPIDCTKEELLLLINEFVEGENRFRNYHESVKIERLKAEIKIKDEIIEKALKR